MRVASFAFSDASTTTIESSITDYSQDDRDNAYTNLFRLNASDGDLLPLFLEASVSVNSSVEGFTNILKRLLKKFAQELRSTVLTDTYKRATYFISRRAQLLARDIVSLYWGSKDLRNNLSRPHMLSAEFLIRRRRRRERRN